MFVAFRRCELGSPGSDTARFSLHDAALEARTRPVSAANQVSCTTSSATTSLRNIRSGQPHHRMVVPAHQLNERRFVSGSQPPKQLRLTFTRRQTGPRRGSRSRSRFEPRPRRPGRRGRRSGIGRDAPRFPAQ